MEIGVEQCRLCLASTSSKKCIFTTEDDNKISLATKIMVCTSLMVTSNDDKPQYLCVDCEDKLESFFDFKNKCLHSHFQLCFDTDVTIDKTIPTDNNKTRLVSSNFDVEIKEEKIDFYEENIAENCDSLEIPVSTVQVQVPEGPTNSINGPSVTNHAQKMECGNCLHSFFSLEELDEHWNFCGANKKKNEEWHKELIKLNSENTDVNHRVSNVNTENHSIDDKVETNNVKEQGETFKCTDCVKVFNDPKLLTEHLSVHKNDKRYSCRECPKTFIDHYELKYHMRIHSGDDRYKCKECGKSFSRPSSLRRHLLIHSRVRPYKCRYCPKTFAHAYNVPPHERIHTGEMPYTCCFCSKSFYECSAKVKHEKNHVRSNKMFQCDICNRMFATHEEMDEHFNSHDSQMVWKCKTCKREFKKPSVLKAHSLKWHDDKLPFECEICFESFAVQIELKAHINVHTGDIA